MDRRLNNAIVTRPIHVPTVLGVLRYLGTTPHLYVLLINKRLRAMLSLLPKDIVNIVYRLTYDHRYGIVKHQYEQQWLNDRFPKTPNSSSDSRYYWDIKDQQFKRVGVDQVAVNYRILQREYFPYRYVFTFDGVSTNEPLPANYQYSSGWAYNHR